MCFFKRPSTPNESVVDKFSTRIAYRSAVEPTDTSLTLGRADILLTPISVGLSHTTFQKIVDTVESVFGGASSNQMGGRTASSSSQAVSSFLPPGSPELFRPKSRAYSTFLLDQPEEVFGDLELPPPLESVEHSQVCSFLLLPPSLACAPLLPSHFMFSALCAWADLFCVCVCVLCS